MILNYKNYPHIKGKIDGLVIPWIPYLLLRLFRVPMWTKKERRDAIKNIRNGWKEKFAKDKDNKLSKEEKTWLEFDEKID